MPPCTVPPRTLVLGLSALMVAAVGIVLSGTGRDDGGREPAASSRRVDRSAHLAWADATHGSAGHDESVDDLDEDDQRRTLKFVRPSVEGSLRADRALLSPARLRCVLDGAPADRFLSCLRC